MEVENLDQNEAQLGKQMSFLEHLDELRRRLINSVLIIVVAFCICWFFSQNIYNFLAIPVQKAMGEAQRVEIPVVGLNGDEKVLPLTSLKEGDKGRYVFDRPAKLGIGEVTAGTSVESVVAKDGESNVGLYTDEPIYTSSAIIPKGIKILDFKKINENAPSADESLIVTTPTESFTLLVTVSLYTAIAFSMPLLLLQIWGFIAPALYKHERSYVTPFILLSTTSFVIGAAFAYYILFPPALKYLLGLGSGTNFRLMLRATDYFDFITLIMLAMGVIFQMPAISYVLARIGLISAGLLARSWRMALIIILLVAAIVSPTGDALNLMLFATPMMGLYVISILIAWIFGKKRNPDDV